MGHLFRLCEPGRCKRHATCGFTLIELLVVITIIVVLLALLTPALDKAIYQAELAVCAADQDAASTGMTTYTIDNRRHYPNRVDADGEGIQPHVLNDWIWFEYDIRPLLRDYMSINAALQDGLGTEVDLELTDDDSFVFSDFALYADWRYVNPGLGVRESGMQKLGDRWSWTSDEGDGPPAMHRFNVLVGDYDYQFQGNLWQSNHPDRGGVMSELVLQDQAIGVDGNEQPMFGIGVTKITFGGYRTPFDSGLDYRGLADLNFAFGDGSVERFGDVVDARKDVDGDDRMIWTPAWNTVNGWPDNRIQTPRP